MINNIKTEIDEMVDSLQALNGTGLEVLGMMELSAIKLGSLYGDLSDFKKMVVAITEQGKTIKTVSGIALNRIRDSISSVETKTKLATIASDAFFSIMSPKGIALISAAFFGVVPALMAMTQKEDQALKKAKEHTQALKDQRDQWKKTREESKKAMEVSLAQVEATEKYGKELQELIDAGKENEENQGRILFLVDKLNELLPEAGYYYDKVTGKIVDMNGEVVDLEKSLESLIQTQKAQAYLNAYQDDYSEALKGRKEALKEEEELYKEIFDMEQLKAEHKRISDDESLSIDEKHNKLKELLASYNMTGAEFMNIDKIIEELNQSLEECQGRIQDFGLTIDEFEAMESAIYEHDWEKVNQIMNGIMEIPLFDSESGDRDMQALEMKKKELEDFLAYLEKAQEKDKNFNHEILDSVQSKIDFIDEELQKGMDQFSEDTKENYENMGKEAGESFQQASNGKVIESSGELADLMTMAVQNGIDQVNSLIACAQIASLKVPVELEYPNLPSSFGATMSMWGASYDDSVEESSLLQPFSSEASSFMAEARSTIQSIQSRIARGILSAPGFEIKPALANNKQVDVHQVNNFNVPVQKPSDVTRAIEKMNRELAKKL